MISADLNILVVDDMPAMRQAIKQILRGIGFSNFSEAEDGQKAWDLLKSNKEQGNSIDLIICDWKMPNVSGIEFLNMVRSEEEYKDTPFLMVTTEGAKGNVIEAIQAGVDNYLVKPVTPQKLQEKVEFVLKKRKKL